MTDPVDTISSGLRALSMNNMQDHFDVAAHQARQLSTGPFAEAKARQSIWEKLAQKKLSMDNEPDLLQGGNDAEV